MTLKAIDWKPSASVTVTIPKKVYEKFRRITKSVDVVAVEEELTKLLNWRILQLTKIKTTRRRIIKLGVSNYGRKPIAISITYIRGLKKKGWSHRLIGEAVGCSPETIRRRLLPK